MLNTKFFEDKAVYQPAIAGILLYMVAPLGMTMLPLLVGTVTEHLGFSDNQAGYLASIDLLGIVVAAVSAPFWLNRFSRKKLASLGISLLVLGNLWSMVSSSFYELSSARFVAEVGSGIAFSLSLAVLGERQRPDRLFSLGIGSTISLAVIVFLWLPDLITQYGFATIFVTHLVMALVIVFFIAWLPSYGDSQKSTKDPLSNPVKAPYKRLLICFAGFFCFTVVEGGVWSYIERIGDYHGLSSSYIGNVLAITQVVSVCASIASTALSTKYGRLFPILFGGATFLVSLYLIQQNQSWLYLVGACMSQFAYIFTLPYLMLLCVELDPSGKYYVLTTAFKMGGFSVGPAIVASMLTGNGFIVVSWVGTVFMGSCLLLIVPLAYRLDKQVIPQTIHSNNKFGDE